MCLYANVFFPRIDRNRIRFPPLPDGLHYTVDELIQQDFLRHAEGTSGAFLSIHDGHCLCQYKDWKVLFDYINALRTKNDIEEIKLLVYWSDASYDEMKEITFDPILDTMKTKPEEGLVYCITVDVSRRLDLWTGKQVRVNFKDGREFFGVLSAFSKANGNGQIELKNIPNPIFFHEKEIRNIDLLDEQN